MKQNINLNKTSTIIKCKILGLSQLTSLLSYLLFIILPIVKVLPFVSGFVYTTSQKYFGSSLKKSLKKMVFVNLKIFYACI